MWCRQVAPCHQVVQTADSTEAGFALFAFSPDLPSRTAVNSHIVVAGASDCGLSVVETLLLHERLHFTAVTLLAPTGVVAPPPDAHYTAGLLKRLVSLVIMMALPIPIKTISNMSMALVSRGFSTVCHDHCPFTAHPLLKIDGLPPPIPFSCTGIEMAQKN